MLYLWLHGTWLCWRRKLCAATPERRRHRQLKSSSIYLWHRTCTCIHDIYKGKLLNPDKTSTQFLKKTVMQIYENQPFILIFILLCYLLTIKKTTVYILYFFLISMFESAICLMMTFQNFFSTEHPYEKEFFFSVGLSHHFQTHRGKIVTCNDIIIKSNAKVYNAQTGKFTTAVDGSYIFHYHGLAGTDQVGL